MFLYTGADTGFHSGGTNPDAKCPEKFPPGTEGGNSHRGDRFPGLLFNIQLKSGHFFLVGVNIKKSDKKIKILPPPTLPKD